MKEFKFNRIGLCLNPNVPVKEGIPLRYGAILIETAEYKPGKWYVGRDYFVTTWGGSFGCFHSKNRESFKSEKEAVWKTLQSVNDDCESRIVLEEGTGDEDFNPKKVKKFIRRLKQLQKDFNYREPSLFDWE